MMMTWLVHVFDLEPAEAVTSRSQFRLAELQSGNFPMSITKVIWCKWSFIYEKGVSRNVNLMLDSVGGKWSLNSKRFMLCP